MSGMAKNNDLKGGPAALAFDRLLAVGVTVALTVSGLRAERSAPRFHTYY